MLSDRLIAAGVMIAIAAVIFIAGAIFDRKVLMKTGREVAETAKHQINHSDGSATAGVVPDGKPTTKAPTKPKGGTTVRILEGEVLPTPVAVPATAAVNGQCPATTVTCAPVKFRWDIDHYNEGDGFFRSSLSVEGGEILDLQDIPVGKFIVNYKNALGVEHLGNGTKAVEYQRDLGRLRVTAGIAIDQDKHATRLLGAAIRW